MASDQCGGKYISQELHSIYVQEGIFFFEVPKDDLL